MVENPSLRILLVEDDPDDYVLTRGALADAEGASFQIEWVHSCMAGLSALEAGSYDVVLLDYHLGEETGLDFLGRMPLEDRTPVILLTGQANREVDLLAMQAGAVDYLVKADVTSILLERSIRYVVEQRRAQEARREAELRYRVLVESAGAIVWQADPETFEFSLVSSEAEVLLGYPSRRWIEDPHFWESHIHPEDRTWVVDYCQQAVQRREPHTFEYRMITADGRVIWLRDIVRLIEFGGRRQLAGVMIDVTERKQTDLLLQAEARVLEMSGRGQPLAAILDTLVRESEGLTERALYSVLLLDQERQTLHVGAAPSLPAAYNQAIEGIAVREGGGSCGTAAYRGEAVLTPDIQADPLWTDFRELAREHNLGACWSHPILATDGSVLGTVAVYTFEARSPDAHELRVMERAVHVAAIAIERARSADALRESETLLRLVTDGLPDPIFLKDREGRYRMVNAAAGSFAGMAPEAMIGRTDAELLPPEVAEKLREDDQRIMKSGQVQTYEEQIAFPGGSMRSHLTTKAPYRNASGEVVGLLGIARDISEYKRAVAELVTAETHYRRLVETSPYGIFVLDAQGQFEEVNAAAAEIVRRSVDTVLGLHLSAVVAPDDLAAAAGAVEAVLSGRKRIAELTFSIVRPSGERRILQAAAAAIEVDEQITGVHGIARDITEEHARDRQMRLLAAALDRLPEQGVSISSPREGFLYSNAAHARILGYQHGSLPREGPDAFIPDEDAQEQLRESMRLVREHGSWSGRIRRKHLGDGRVLSLDAIIGRVKDEGRELIFMILQDATEAIAREQHLRRAERLASVGTLIGGVAHELNNPLHAICNFAELMLMEERSADDSEALEVMRREAERAAKVVSNLRTVARQSQDEGTPKGAVDLNDVVRHVLRLRGYALTTANIEVHEDLAQDLPPVWADRSQMEQVLLNLVVNAEQAMVGYRGGGCLILRTRPSRAGVSLYVVDDGPGIAAEHFDRIFDPFWTTKAPGEGTGLGLSLVHSIIAEHGGELRVESDVAKGAVFAIEIPRASTTPRTQNEAVAPSHSERGLRILVVDDEPALRRSIERYLTRRGHLVETAGEGGEALRLLDRAGEVSYDAILSDLRMPGLNGERFLAALRQRNSGLDRRLVFLTGDAASGDAARVLSTAGVTVLLKPAKLEEIAHALERLAEGA